MYKIKFKNGGELEFTAIHLIPTKHDGQGNDIPARIECYDNIILYPLVPSHIYEVTEVESITPQSP